MFLGTAAVVVVLEPPVAISGLGIATMRNFDETRADRIAEHFLYLGALLMFALHRVDLKRLLQLVKPVAALFGKINMSFGLAMMAASSLFHISTSPLRGSNSRAGN